MELPFVAKEFSLDRANGHHTGSTFAVKELKAMVPTRPVSERSC